MQGNQVAKNVQGTNLVSRTVDGETGYYMYNGHGDVTVVQAAYGDPLATYYYDAFGNILEQTGSINNSTTFAGYTYDKETGLYYLNARMYDPITARFLQEDTYRGQANDPLSLNLYTYCSNNPITYVDPTGHWQESDRTLNTNARIAMCKLTDLYWKAKTPKERDLISKQADNIRKDKGNWSGKKSNTQFNRKASILIKSGNLNAESWNDISPTINDEKEAKIMSDGKITLNDVAYVLGWDNNTSKKNSISNKANTSGSANELVVAAKKELATGFKEHVRKGATEGDNITPYGDWAGVQGQPWCAAFVSYSANEAGVLNSTVPMYTSCTDGRNKYKKAGNFKDVDSGYVPKSGDVIFYSNNGGKSDYHTGIVTAYDAKASTIYTIEGNYGDKISQRKVKLSYENIDGFGVNGGTSYGEIPTNSTSSTNQRTQ